MGPQRREVMFLLPERGATLLRFPPGHGLLSSAYGLIAIFDARPQTSPAVRRHVYRHALPTTPPSPAAVHPARDLPSTPLIPPFRQFTLIMNGILRLVSHARSPCRPISSPPRFATAAELQHSILRLKLAHEKRTKTPNFLCHGMANHKHLHRN
jgi:hypothetical protein